MSNQVLAACAEFPNDNRALHRGAVWHCADVTGPASPELPLIEVVVAQLTEATPEPVAVIHEPIAAATPEPLVVIPEPVVLKPEPVPVHEPAPPISEPAVVIPEPVAVVLEAAAEPTPAPVVVEASLVAEPSTDPSPPVLEAEDEGDDIEIVDEIVLEHVVDESIPPPPPPAVDDPFVALTAVLEDVAKSAGAAEPAMAILRTLLGRERLADDAPADSATLRAQAAGWQAILRGDSEDFSLVGSTSLDEWSSLVIARALGEPSRADAFRRDLRRRGVAAFGLVIEAA